MMKITEAEKMVKAALGDNYSTAPIGGWWAIFKLDADGKMITPPVAHNRSLTVAIRQASK